MPNTQRVVMAGLYLFWRGSEVCI